MKTHEDRRKELQGVANSPGLRGFSDWLRSKGSTIPRGMIGSAQGCPMTKWLQSEGLDVREVWYDEVVFEDGEKVSWDEISVPVGDAPIQSMASFQDRVVDRFTRLFEIAEGHGSPGRWLREALWIEVECENAWQRRGR